MKLTITCFFALATGLMGCVSTSRYQSLASHSEQLQLTNTTLKKENDSLKLLGTELKLTKEQLEKTENVLIEFYQKYEGKSGSGNSKSNPVTESQWDTVQIEMTKLLAENAKIRDQLKKSELEVQGLKQQLQQSENKQSSSKEKNKTIDQLNHQLDELKSAQIKLKSELTLKNDEISSLKKDLARKSSDQKTTEQIKQSSYLIDSLQSQIQFLSMKNKDLSFQMSDLNEKVEEKERLNREKQNEEVIKLQAELTTKNARLVSLEDENRSLSNDLKSKTEELSNTQQSLQQSKEQLNQERQQKENKSKHKEEAEQKLVIEQLKSDLNSRDRNLSALNDALDDNHKEIKELREKLEIQKTELDHMNKELADRSQSRNEDTQRELKDLRDQNAARLNSIQTLQREGDSLKVLTTLLFNQKDKNESEIKTMSDELDAKNKQIEILSLKLSELTDQIATEKQNPLKDSLNYFRGEVVRMQHVNKSLESEINRDHNLIASRESKIDSLKKIIQLKAHDKKEAETNEQTINQLKKDLNASSSEITTLKMKLDSLQLKSTQPQKKESPVIKPLPSQLIDKLNAFSNEHLQNGVTGFIDNAHFNLILAQSAVFEGESMAMTQAGTDLIGKLALILKTQKEIKIEITGYGSMDANGNKSFDNSFKRANTVFKLMSVSGVNSSLIKLGALLNNTHNNPKIPSAGIELAIHVN